MPGAGLSACFDQDLFVPSLKASDKDGVFEELVACLVASGRVLHGDIILNTVREREKTWTTAIGNGVAIPHGRSLVVRDLTVVFGRSEKGVDFGAEDGEPVRLVFLIVAPYQDRGNRYLPVLGDIVKLCAQDDVREKLLSLDDFGELGTVLEGAG